MKHIYILLTKSDTVLSRCVHMVTGASYTHVSIGFDKDLTLLYSSSRKNGRTLFPAGPCREHFYKGYYSRHQHIPCTLHRIEVSDEVYAKALEEVHRIIDRSELYHFNIVGLALCQFGIEFEREYNFFCSQFVGNILDRSGTLELPKAVTLMKPIDYLGLPQLDHCYTGNIKGLRKYLAYA